MNNIEIIKMLINALDSTGVQDEAIKTAALALLDNIKVAPKQEQPKEPKPAKSSKPSGRKGIDHGKIIALHNAGWPVAKIADEMGISVQTVHNHLKKEADI